MTRAVLAIDIGGTKIASAVVTAGSVSPVQTAATPATSGPDAVLEAAWKVAQAALRAHDQAGGATAELFGISSAGVIDPASGEVLAATDALPGWAGTNVARELWSRSGLPAHALNDVHAHGLGEATYGYGRGLGSMLLVAAGTGVGGAYVVDGRVITGARHLAGHIGHLPSVEAAGMPCPCGRAGHLEAIASGTGLARAFAQARGAKASETPLTGREVLEAAHDENHADFELANVTTHRAGTALGRMIGGLMNALDPEAVVLTGGVSGAGPHWHDAVREGMAREVMDPLRDQPLVLAQASHAALLGAAQWAQDQEK